MSPVEDAPAAAVEEAPPAARQKKQVRRKTPNELEEPEPWTGDGPRPPHRVKQKNKLLHEARSHYSRLRVRQTGSRRALFFVQAGGTEWPQTIMDVLAPHEPAMPYLRHAFVGLLHRPDPKRVLIVGLGGGAMVSILRHASPETHVTAIEIDPEVVRAASEWFGVKPDEHTEIVTGDGITHVLETNDKWDIIFMDAFLEPSAQGTDSSGVPQHSKTAEFLTALRGRLTPKGVVVFNLHHKSDMAKHLSAIEAAFESVVMYKVEGTGNRITVASPRAAVKPATLKRRAKALQGSPAEHLRLIEVLEHAL